MKKHYEEPLFVFKSRYFNVITMSGDNNIIDDPYNEFDESWFGGEL